MLPSEIFEHLREYQFHFHGATLPQTTLSGREVENFFEVIFARQCANFFFISA
jgi:hypothetical protein